MKSASWVVAALIVLSGCSKPEPEVVRDPPAPPGATKAGPGDGITPLGAGAGPMTPVVGGNNLGGTTGGGIAQGMKNRAKNLAEQSSAPPAEEGGESQDQ